MNWRVHECVGIEQSRKTYDEITSLIENLQEKTKDHIPLETEVDVLSNLSFNSLEFDLDLLDRSGIETREGDLALLGSLRKTMKRVRSVDTINMSNNHVLVHFKENHDLDVVLAKDVSQQYVIESASVRM